MKKIELIARKARNSLTHFCITECKSYCCRKGYLLLSNKETKLVLNNEEEAIKKAGHLIKIKGKNSYFLGNPDSCTSLDKKTFFCKIYDNKLRPETCRHFPVFVKDNKIIFSNRCLGVKQGRMYPFEEELILNKIKYNENINR